MLLAARSLSSSRTRRKAGCNWNSLSRLPTVHALDNQQSTNVSKMQARRRPSVTSRLSFAISNASNAELGETDNGPAIAAEQQIEEEIAEIKRYEVRQPSPAPPTPLARSPLLLCLGNKD